MSREMATRSASSRPVTVYQFNPLDYEPLVESVKKTGRVVLSGDACARGSVMQTLAANLGQLAFDDLDADPALIRRAKADLAAMGERAAEPLMRLAGADGGAASTSSVASCGAARTKRTRGQRYPLVSG